MKTRATNLSSEQVEQAWEYAELLANQNPQHIRTDFLGAIIHREDYEDINSEYGWCVEYVLSPTFLAAHGIPTTNIFCEENIRVLNIANQEANRNNNTGHYEARCARCNTMHNQWQQVWQISDITEEGISALQTKFNLSADLVSEIFQ